LRRFEKTAVQPTRAAKQRLKTETLKPEIRLTVGLLRFGGRVVQAAFASVVAGANRGKRAGFRKREGNHLLHYPQHKFGAAGDVEFLEQTVQVHVNGVRRNFEFFGYRRLVLIVKHALDNLQFALGDFQGVANLKPGMVGEQ
jgi:hypothetical protein